MIRVILPYHLRNLARVQSEIQVDVPESATVDALLDAVEARYPMLKGTIREHDTKKRRAFVRFFACGDDYSMSDNSTVLPEKVLNGREPFLIVGAIAGG
ncbi:MoaD/ThiS family protein [Chryseolinea sp. H1M3-3]|uniref:MoaD/ThiS family protein n=1 Tax=Chryseolinea sp. H1M3-3 TaxID=3034144 RepID=UPI0023ECB58F|nr:MoaD/ThiS family protein [Chryseolinea sp. H1M3-3]